MKIFDVWFYSVIYVYDNICKVRKNLRENLNIETLETQLVFTGNYITPVIILAKIMPESQTND